MLARSVTVWQLSSSLVLGDVGGSCRSVLFAESEAGRSTAAFLQRYTQLTGNADFVSFHSVPRLMSRVLQVNAGHTVIVVGALSVFTPLCLALINGGASTDTIVPKDEIRALFRRSAVVQLQAWDPNPLLSNHSDSFIEQQQHMQPQVDGTDGVISVASANPSLALLSLLSWTLSSRDEDDSALSEEQRLLRSLSRQRTHVQGKRQQRQRFERIPGAAHSTA